MERFFLATGAIFHLLHLVRMGAFIAGCDVVLLTADRAFKVTSSRLLFAIIFTLLSFRGVNPNIARGNYLQENFI
jgi:hypothetical protein